MTVLMDVVAAKNAAVGDRFYLSTLGEVTLTQGGYTTPWGHATITRVSTGRTYRVVGFGSTDMVIYPADPIVSPRRAA